MVTVFGRVQGVGFRYYAEKLGNSLGLNGYAKNQIDGSVLIEAEGDSRNLDLFIEKIKRGPSFAHVEQTAVQYDEYLGDLPAFEIRF